MPERRTDVAYEVPGVPEPIPFGDAFVMDAPTVKQGMHHPEGLLIIHGRGVPRGKRLESCNNLDLAPTMLSILGITPPAPMTGRALVHFA
jgi:predicted AlkP superfamily phosphohydrolase/phosphomutase